MLFLTLVPNLLLQLNGSKCLIVKISLFIAMRNIIFVLYSVVLLMIAGCSISKQAPKEPVTTNKETVPAKDETMVYNPQTKQYEKVKINDAEPQKSVAPKKDSVQPEEIKPIVLPQKSEPQVMKINNLRTSARKNSYEVAMILPFNTSDPNNSSDNISRNSSWAVHFYSGVKLALKQFENTGIQINLSVIDSKNSDEEIDKLILRDEIKRADLIIGPYKSNQSKKMVEFVKDKNITLVSPYTTSSNPTKSNPNYIQANPSITRHFECLSKSISESFPVEKVYFLTQDNNTTKSRSKNFKEILATYYKNANPKSIHDIIVPDNFMTSENFKIDSLIDLSMPVAIVVPAWEDKYVKDILRKIDNERGGKQVTVYGMPQWQFMDEIKTYLNNLNARISSNVLLNTSKSEVEIFRNTYFDTYAKMPDMDAFLGHDIASYFFIELIKNGTFFQQNCSPSKELVSRFNILPVRSELSGEQTIDFYENFGLQILQFKWSGFYSVE